MTFNSTSELRVRNPKNMLAVGSTSKVSMYFKTNQTSGLLFYLGPDVGPRIVCMTSYYYQSHLTPLCNHRVSYLRPMVLVLATAVMNARSPTMLSQACVVESVEVDDD